MGVLLREVGKTGKAHSCGKIISVDGVRRGRGEVALLGGTW